MNEKESDSDDDMIGRKSKRLSSFVGSENIKKYMQESDSDDNVVRHKSEKESDSDENMVCRKSKRISNSENYKKYTQESGNIIVRKSKRFSELNGSESGNKRRKVIYKETDSLSGSSTSYESNIRTKRSYICKKIKTEKKKIKPLTCHSCRNSNLNMHHRMVGCMLCKKYFHINCFLPCDRPIDVVFKDNQCVFMKRRCFWCLADTMCYKTRQILAWRWRKEALDVEDPAQYFMPREFLVLYKNVSYWDCEWISELKCEITEYYHFLIYKAKNDMTVPTVPMILSESHRAKMSKTDLELHEKYYKWGIESEWLQPDRVLELTDVDCTVKWRGLTYDFNSVEPLTRVDEIDGLKEAVEKFRKLKNDLINKSFVPVNKSKLTKLLESPDYLGPLNSTAKDKPSLHPYQLEGLNWLRSSYSNEVNTILADEMGLGKTIQAIAFLYSLFKDNVSKGPFLVAVPLSTLKNWEREFEFWAPELCVLSYYGDKDCRKEIKSYLFFKLNDKKIPAFHVLLTTYELIYVDDSILYAFRWEVMIIDEAHRLKNDTSKLFQTFKKYKIKYRNLMTGTPLQNNLEELFHLLNFMEPQSFNDVEEFMSQFQDVSKEKKIRTLKEMLKKHILRRLKIDVLKHLPAKEEQLIRVDLTKFQKEFYKMILTNNFDVLGKKYSTMRLSNLIMHLRKVCNHPYLMMTKVDNQMRADGTYEANALLSASGKMELLQKMLIKLRSTGHRVLIFSGMTKLLDLVEHMLEDIDIEYERIDGSVSSDSRQNAIDRFNDPESESMVFLLSTRAGGLGINLSSADTVIIYDSDWNPHNDIQAMSRAHRIGQMKKVMIYRFVTRNTVEEKIMETAKRKMIINNIVVNDCTKNEFHQILSFGTKELFDENVTEDQRIAYDDAAIEVLLDRNRPVVVNYESNLLDECFSGFKVADCHYATDKILSNTDNPQSNANNDVDMIDDMAPQDYWSKLLEPLLKNKLPEKEPELGKGLRNRNKVVPNFFPSDLSDNASSDGKGARDVDYILTKAVVESDNSSEENETEEIQLTKKELQSLDSEGIIITKIEGFDKANNKYNFDKDFKELIDYGFDTDSANKIGLSGPKDKHTTKICGFHVVNGFSAVERMDIYTALMNYGLPPKILRKSDFWWPGTLQHKTAVEMHKFISNLMMTVISNSDKFPDDVPKDMIDYHLLKARIGLNGLIAFKVNQFEVQNRVILETITNKQFNIQTQSIDEIKSVFSDVADSTFEFNIWDGEFSKIHSLWREYDSKCDSDITKNPIFEWNKLHDYELLSAMALYGYDNYLDQIFQDPQFHLLFVPFKLMKMETSNIETHGDNLEIMEFIRHRQVILENALLIESQLIKISMLFDDSSPNRFSLDKLKFFHDMFVSQSGNYYLIEDLVITRTKLKAIAQLELLINDIECDSAIRRSIDLRQIEN